LTAVAHPGGRGPCPPRATQTVINNDYGQNTYYRNTEIVLASTNIPFKVFRKDILAAEIAENLLGSWGSAPNPAGGAYRAPANSQAGWEGLAALSKNPPRLRPSGRDFRLFGPRSLKHF